MSRARLVTVLACAALLLAHRGAGADPVPPGRAGEFVGREATIEGRVLVTHSSQLATVLGFAPNFAGFTASVLATDRTKFPPNFEQRCRDKLVRVTGVVSAYRGKPEMTIREPSQLMIVPAPGESPVAAALVLAEPSPPTPSPLPTPDALGALEERIRVLEARLGVLEQTVGAGQAGGSTQTKEGASPLDIGTPAARVRELLGDPVQIVVAGAEKGSVWVYGGGRSVSFDRTGRVVGWMGF